MEQLAATLLERANNDDGQRVVVLMYGPPGSGKTTIAGQLVDRLNGGVSPVCEVTNNRDPYRIYTGAGGEDTQICEYTGEPVDQESPFAVHLKMDGFHLPLKTLDPKLVPRRGCYESFDAELVVKLCELLTSNEWTSLTIPDFDHKIKDPTNPGIRLSSRTKIVVLEGLYLMLDIPPWNQIKQLTQSLKLAKYPIFIVNINGGEQDQLAHRVAKRHLKCQLVHSYKDGIAKYYSNDLLNAEIVIKNSINSLTDYTLDNSSREQNL